MPKDTHEWSVEYHNGVIIPEFDDERPDGRGFSEIDSSQVRCLRLHLEGFPAHNVTIPDGATPIFRRRRRIAIDPSTEGQSMKTTHIIGWEKDGKGSYLFVFADGSTLVTDNFNAV